MVEIMGYSVPSFAQRYDTSVSTIRRLITSGSLPSTLISPGVRRITPKNEAEWLSNLESMQMGINKANSCTKSSGKPTKAETA